MIESEEPQRNERPPPTVFMSYSHDSAEHKMWVAGLAKDLMRNGIDAVLDQWSLRPGMDAPSFMETAIRGSDRVCVICTPKYARKADAGKGGVGYEKMIVTGELYKDLGSAKFIPIITAGSDEAALPTFLKSRMYVDFRDAARYKEKLEGLLRELHGVPASMTPPLGNNPFVRHRGQSDQESPISLSLTAEPVPITTESPLAPAKVYFTCQELFRRGDAVGWRELLKELKRPMEEGLNRWREEVSRKQFAKMEEFLPAIEQAVQVVMPLMTLGLASVESSIPMFNDQRSIVDEILNMSRWQRSGPVIIAELPETLVYVYYHLHGAVCVFTGQIETALSLAMMKVYTGREGIREPLWSEHHLTGWPRSLGGTYGSGWEFLRKLPDRFPWLGRVFVGQDDYWTALAGYSMLLSALDMAKRLKESRKAGHELSEGSGQVTFDVPPAFLLFNESIQQRAFSLAFRDSNSVSLIATRAGIGESEMRENWRGWVRRVAVAARGWAIPRDYCLGDLP